MSLPNSAAVYVLSIGVIAVFCLGAVITWMIS